MKPTKEEIEQTCLCISCGAKLMEQIEWKKPIENPREGENLLIYTLQSGPYIGHYMLWDEWYIEERESRLHTRQISAWAYIEPPSWVKGRSY